MQNVLINGENGVTFKYKNGFFNSIFGQKNVVNTTEGYNYLAMNDDIYMYTGITSVLADESNFMSNPSDVGR